MLAFLIRRLVLLALTVAAITVVAFVVITLPPGDFVDRVALEAAQQGDPLPPEVEADLRRAYGLDRGLWAQYAAWMEGMVVRGDFGFSFGWDLPVADLIGQRLGLTAVLSVVTLLFVWIVAIPIGIYSAVRQYGLGDYVFTFLGFVGLAVPNFLLALVLLYVSFRYFGQSVGGLFSPEHVDAPWSWARVGDLISHLWIPVVVLGTAGTAAVIRVMRANLLDELHRPYVLTARARGLSETRTILKYPVRHALNPFVSGLNELFVTIVSGETIVAVVLGLQTVGPLLLGALLAEDMYLAATLIMFLSFLAVLGTLFSDLALMALDPRIRRQAQRREML